MTSPLCGITVLDLSRVLAGPWCSMTLADMGADVIKVESLKGDDTRTWGPPFIGEGAHKTSAYFACVNRNKKSIALDLKTQEGQKIIHELAAKADVILENFRTGVPEKLGVGYEQLKKVNAGLIYCSISGYGRTGSRAKEAGYDFVIQAEGGIMSITGARDGKPQKVGVAIADITTGQNATNAILAALFSRTKTGQGQWIDISLFDTQLQWLANVASNVLFSGQEAKRWGNAHASIVPYQAFEAEDHWFAVAVGNDNQWQRLCDILENPAWKDDAKYATNPARVTNRDALIPQLEELFSKKPAAHWLERLHHAGIACSEVASVQQAVTKPIAKERGMRISLKNALGEDIPMLGSPLNFSETPVQYHTAPPLVGEHTAEILKTHLGMEEGAVNTLAERGVVGVWKK